MTNNDSKTNPKPEPTNNEIDPNELANITGGYAEDDARLGEGYKAWQIENARKLQ